MKKKVLSLMVVGLMFVAVPVTRAGWRVGPTGLVYEKGEVLSQGSDDTESEGSGSSGSSSESSELPTPTSEQKRNASRATELKVEKREGKERLELRIKTEKGEEEDLGEQEELEIEDEVELATGEGKLIEVRHKGVHAETELPISIDLKTRLLTVTTPAGVRTVAILPDEAVANLLRQGVVDGVSTGSGQIELKAENGEVRYEIEGEVDEKFLGIVPVKIKKRVVVSAQTGENLGESQGLLDRILELLSI